MFEVSRKILIYLGGIMEERVRKLLSEIQAEYKRSMIIQYGLTEREIAYAAGQESAYKYFMEELENLLK
jgi:AAA+ ATPase superfamily predicted ATPase